MIPHWRPVIVEVPITVATDAYTAEDSVGGLLTSDAIPQVKGGGYIEWVRLVDDACQAEPFDLYVFKEQPSTVADAAEYVPLEADWLKCIGRIDIAAADYNTLGTEADMALVAGKDEGTGEPIVFDALPSGKLYFYLVANASTPDYADANDLTMHVCLMLA